jgi:hypothetical protein
VTVIASRVRLQPSPQRVSQTLTAHHPCPKTQHRSAEHAEPTRCRLKAAKSVVLRLLILMRHSLKVCPVAYCPGTSQLLLCRAHLLLLRAFRVGPDSWEPGYPTCRIPLAYPLRVEMPIRDVDAFTRTLQSLPVASIRPSLYRPTDWLLTVRLLEMPLYDVDAFIGTSQSLPVASIRPFALSTD